MLKVTLVEHTPNPEKLIATAAKLCYSASNVEDLQKGLTDDKIHSFLEMLMNLGHESPMEHVTFTFVIEGISRSCSHQLVRHRIASYSQQSQRYVDMNQFEYVIPPSIEYASDPALKERYCGIMSSLQKDYDLLVKALTVLTYENIRKEKGFVDGNEPSMEIQKKILDQAKKQANEDARFILPNACETRIMVTMNIRSLYNFFKHRMCNRAQWEIRALAWEMWRQCMNVSPLLFKHAGPSCVYGKCPEGKMSCGNSAKVKVLHHKYVKWCQINKKPMTPIMNNQSSYTHNSNVPTLDDISRELFKESNGGNE